MNEMDAASEEISAVPVSAESKDFGARWGEMLEDTFTVALEKLEAELEAIGSRERQKFDVTDVSRKGKTLMCTVSGFIPQMEVFFREGSELQVRSKIKSGGIVWSNSTFSREDGSESSPISAVLRGVSVLDDDGHIGTVRLHLDLVSRGEIPMDAEVNVSADVSVRKRKAEKERQLLEAFLKRMEIGDVSSLQKKFMAGDFKVSPDAALGKSQDLDESQNGAFGRAMLGEEYPVLFIQGPPGTGKTRTIREIVDGHIGHGKKVLVLSHSNRGKDEPAKQLLAKWMASQHKKKAGSMAEGKLFIAGSEPEKIDPGLRKFRIKKDHKFPQKQLDRVAKMNLGELVKKGVLQGSTNSIFHGSGADEMVAEARQDLKDFIVADYKRRCRRAEELFSEKMEDGGAVFSTFGNLLNDEILAGMHFDVVVVDESTRMQAPELVMALQKAGKQIIFVGDPEQLGNIPMDPEMEKGLAKKLEGLNAEEIIDSSRKGVKRVYDAESASRALEVFQDGPYTSGIKCAENPDKELPFVFLNQGRRSLPNITKLVSEFTYGGRLEAAREAEDGNEGKVLWLDTKNLRGSEKTEGTSRRNPTESLIIGRKVVDALLREGLDPAQVGVIATYASQVHAIRNGVSRILRGTDGGEEVIDKLLPNIDSVDGFQGDQRDFVFMSFVRSNKTGAVGFTDERSRINVGISRAGDCLVIVGDSSTLIDNNQDPVSRARFEKLRDLVAKHGEVREITFHQERKRKRNPNKRRAARRKTRERKIAWVEAAE